MRLVQRGFTLRPPAPVAHSGSLPLISLLKALWTNPLEAWSERYFQQPIVRSRFMVGEVAVVSDPLAIRHVLTKNAGNYRKDFVQKRMLAKLANGLLMAEGDQWRHQRRVLAPIFTPQSVGSFAAAMTDCVGRLAQRWRARDGATIDVAADVTLLTLEVLERTIFSDGLGRDAGEVRDAMRMYFDRIGRIDPLDMLGAPAIVPRLGRTSIRSAFRVFEQAVDTIIATRRRRLQEGLNEAPRDILTLLLQARDPENGCQISEAELRANIITLIAAGHETTANAITWSLYLLSQSSEWRERIVHEADCAFGDPARNPADNLPQTRAVIEEAMRLYPPLAAVSRVAIGPDELGAVPIRAGTLVVIAPYVLHRHRLLWDKPDEFDPSRFLGERRAQIDRYAYLPFGAGPRACLGSVFALQEAVLAVAAIVKNVELTVAPGHRVWPVHRVTLRPRGGLPMIVRARQAESRTNSAAAA